MKKLKRASVLAVAIMTLITTMALPAFATISGTYYSHVCSFYEIYNGSPRNAYIRAAQCFLYHYSYKTRTTIVNGGGIDGGFGNATENAVIQYQKDKWPYTSSEWDGRVGSKTWAQIATDLEDGDEGFDQEYLHCNGIDDGKVIFVDTRAEAYSYYCCTASGVKDRLIVTKY